MGDQAQDRQNLWRDHKTNVQQLKEEQREHHQATKRRLRKEALDYRRVKLPEVTVDEPVKEAQVTKAIQNLKHHNQEKKIEGLRCLQIAFSESPKHGVMFLETEAALNVLVSAYTSHHGTLQAEAAYTLTNLTARLSRPQDSLSIVKLLGSYLSTYLTSGISLMQDHAAWTVGNLCGCGAADPGALSGEGAESPSALCSSTLLAQGAVQPLVKLLQSGERDVQRSAAYAVRNVVRGTPEVASALCREGAVRVCVELVSAGWSGLERDTLADILWSVFTVVSRDDAIPDAGDLLPFFKVLTDILHSYAAQSPLLIKVVTPIIRIMGNIWARRSEFEEETLDDLAGQCITALVPWTHLTSAPHVARETLWALRNIFAASGRCVKDEVTSSAAKNVVEAVKTASPDSLESLECLYTLLSSRSSALDVRDVISALHASLHAPHAQMALLSLGCLAQLARVQHQEVTAALSSEDTVTPRLAVLQHHSDSSVRHLAGSLLHTLRPSSCDS